MAGPMRFFWLAAVVVPGLVLQVASCSDDPAAVTAGTDAASDTAPVPTTPFPIDDAAKPPVKRPPPVIPTCVGDTLAFQPSGERGYVSVNMAADGGDAGPIRGDFLLDFGANGSTIDLVSGFVPPGPPQPASCFGDAAAPGASCQFNDFDFFGPWGTVTLVTGDYRFLINSVKQAGIIGTDFLSVYPFTLDYARGKVFRGKTGSFCTDAQLLGAGFSPIPAGGFYTNKFSSLRPLSDVIDDPDAAATAGYVVPNVPTVPITIAGAAALAQLDTGYDDRITRHSINVNEALLAQLRQKTPAQITRRMSKDVYLTTCVPGLSQLASAYELTVGSEVNFVGEGGAIARHDTGTYIFVKQRLAGADRCGGIETWTVPAAQMGASFLVDAYAVVFDPITSRVWIPKD